MDAISCEDSDVNDPYTVYVHIPIKVEDIPYTDDEKSIVTLCGGSMNSTNTLWYEGLTMVNCPLCLYAVAIGKAARIGKSRLPKIEKLEI
jgi:hypothetical protein